VQLALAVFEGLSECEIAAIEEIALDRRFQERCQEPICPPHQTFPADELIRLSSAASFSSTASKLSGSSRYMARIA
jgi:hypothetical protein